MNALELRIPPPGVALVCGGVMWLVASRTPALAAAIPWRPAIAAALLAAGAAIDLAGLVAFRRASTTFNPLRPDNASALVTSGIYRYSRNPMYLGLLLILAAWSVWLAHPLAALVLPAFVAYIDRFQIAPEERVLAVKFGAEFGAYCRAVRRWV